MTIVNRVVSALIYRIADRLGPADADVFIDLLDRAGMLPA